MTRTDYRRAGELVENCCGGTVADALDPVEEGLSTEIMECGGHNAIVVVASGELDSQTIPELNAAVEDALSRPGTTCLVLDLDRIVFFGSAGVAYLTQADTEARSRSIEFRLVVPPTSRVHRVLDVMGLIRLMALYPTREDALAST